MENRNILKNRKNQARRMSIIKKLTGDGRCWWVHQYIIGNMNSRKSS